MAPSPRRLASALSRDPRASTMPLRGAPPRPQFPPTQSSQPQQLTRLSPGVYRDASGGLVNQQGGALPNQPQQGGMAQPYGNLQSIYGQANSIPGARQDRAMIPPNSQPMPRGGGNMEAMGQQLSRDAYMMNQIRSGNIPQMQGNNMISRGVNQMTRDLYQQAQQKYPQQEQFYNLPEGNYGNYMPGQLPQNYQSMGGFQGFPGVQQAQYGAMQQALQGANTGIVAQQNYGRDSRQLSASELQNMQAQAQAYNQQQVPSPNNSVMQPQFRRY